MNDDFILVYREPLNYTLKENRLVWDTLYDAGLMQYTCTTHNLFNRFIIIKQSNLHFEFDINETQRIPPRELTLELINSIKLNILLGFPLSSLQYDD